VPAAPDSQDELGAAWSTAPTSRLNACDLKGVRFLIVDDDDDSREILCTALEHCGAIVFSAPSAEGAIAQARTACPDILVCDIGMPGTDGYTLLRQWRALPESAGQKTVAIAVTGFARSEDARRAIDAGFQFHLAKPLDLRRFTETAAKLVGRPVA
jgi:CheY-like chemotaxis protein